jgi:spore germination protein YaaH
LANQGQQKAKALSMFTLPKINKTAKKFFLKDESWKTSFLQRPQFISEKTWSYLTLFLASFCLMLVIGIGSGQGSNIISPLVAPLHSLSQKEVKKGYEVFGFGPFWTINKLDNVDFNTLTTFAYFGVPVLADGSLDRDDQGYTVFQSKKATDIFKKAHKYGTRVVLTITQMDNDTIDALLSDPDARTHAVNEAVAAVKDRGIDGINVDFEYVGNPGQAERDSFSHFISELTTKMHHEVPGSKVSVSVYASSASSPKLYDIAAIAKDSDNIFMMAYDFAVAGSNTAMPTAPLYGKKQGLYSNDVSSSVNEFLSQMPANKLILGVPYYGYNYVVSKPAVNAATYPSWSWKGSPATQTYELARNNNQAEVSGWDDVGKVGWEAYYVPETGAWRMIFLEDTRSLSYKYDFAKSKNLAGVGMWALGFDDGKPELWALLRDEFGSSHIADNRVVNRTISEASL